MRRFGYGYHVVGVPKNWDKSKVHFNFGGSFGKPYDNIKKSISTPLILEEILQSGSMVVQLAYDIAVAILFIFHPSNIFNKVIIRRNELPHSSQCNIYGPRVALCRYRTNCLWTTK